MIKYIRKTQGFTIIETLVAVTILMIAIAGPLTIANQALTAAYDAKNQMIAANLAQETVEAVKNYKDNALSQGASLQNVIGTFSGQKAMEDSDGNFNIYDCINANNCRLYQGDDGYSYLDGDGLSPFTRYFTVSQILVNGNPSTDEYLLTVTVTWNTGPITNQIQIPEILTNSTR